MVGLNVTLATMLIARETFSFGPWSGKGLLLVPGEFFCLHGSASKTFWFPERSTVSESTRHIQRRQGIVL